MDTNIGGEQAAPRSGHAVELVYLATQADLADALRARSVKTPAGRRLRWLYPVLGMLLLLLGLVVMVADGAVSARPVGFAASGVVLWALTPFVPRFVCWLQARAFAGLLKKAGEARAVVDGSGVLVRTAATEMRIGWAAQPTYVETQGSFVMLSDDKGAVAMTVLPKRGVREPADVDRLRTILDLNLRRL
ncbi:MULTISPECIES: hypothetical protein [unclassified Streptomyces]|uniref:hypothetical protein n=1 Tax=unclassified Streptomyces TaxID=2593676 RepID=UPI001BE8EB54|nr:MULTISPECIES: hypothetical protein [unclassified Streptomyces]MBT2404325.1 hypothetical protein [Streptomyces sp. ISL-21]MBT2458130.1 hypothetical protein [Streptomyces sp. ISL-86]MBT2607124.1 hypothetical protein [Streptomyces sp. ISL-87]